MRVYFERNSILQYSSRVRGWVYLLIAMNVSWIQSSFQLWWDFLFFYLRHNALQRYFTRSPAQTWIVHSFPQKLLKFYTAKVVITWTSFASTVQMDLSSENGRIHSMWKKTTSVYRFLRKSNGTWTPLFFFSSTKKSTKES